ncbi:phage head-tail connector protein [Mycobacterium gordonae]|nr:phage head-tail connector protein [Mycobacterium gordonae]
MTPLERMKIRLEIPLSDTAKDGRLTIMLSDAENAFKVICRRPDVPSSAENLIERMAVHLYSKPPAVESESVKDMSLSYESDYPPAMLREIHRYRRIGAR